MIMRKKKRDSFAEVQSAIPVVVVEGFMAASGEDRYQKRLPDRKVFVARVGPASSIHDRACELYYSIKGGMVDYGEEHSSSFRHGRFGRTYPQGLYPQWSTSKPLHFLGHSMGGPTIIKLAALLANGMFGPDSHPDMILSVTSVSAAFRGTPLVYTLGMRVDRAPEVRPHTAGRRLARESRGLSYKDSDFKSLLHQLRKSDWAESRDAGPYDVTFESVDDREKDGEGFCNPRTYYRSYAAWWTNRKSPTDARHVPPMSKMLCVELFLCSRSIGSFDYSTLRPLPSFWTRLRPSADEKRVSQERLLLQLGDEYWANDGTVPLFSQWHPHDCSATKCLHHDPSTNDAIDNPFADPPAAGIWHVHSLPGAHHRAVFPLYLGTERQREFWKELNQYLHTIDDSVII